MQDTRLKRRIVLVLAFCYMLMSWCKIVQAQSQGEITNASVKVNLFTKEVAATKLTFIVYDVEKCPYATVGYKVDNSLTGYTYPGFWENIGNGWLFTYEDVVPFNNITGEFPYDRYSFQLYLLTNLTTAFESIISRGFVYIISPNYISTASGQEITGKDELVDFALHTENLTHAYQIDVSIGHPKGFGQAVIPFVLYLPTAIFLLGLLLVALLVKDWLGAQALEGFPSTAFIGSVVSILIFLPMYWFAIHQFQSPLSHTSFDTTLFGLTISYLLIVGMAITLRLGGERLRGSIRNVVRSDQGGTEVPERVATPEHVIERLDRAFDLILILVGLITAAILQYAAALGDLSFTTFSIRFLFIPIIPLVLFWLSNKLAHNPSFRIFTRVFVWFYGTFTLFTDIWFFLVLVFGRQFAASKPFTVAASIVLYVIAFLLDRRVEEMYGYRRREITRISSAAYLLAIALIVLTTILAYLPSP